MLPKTKFELEFNHGGIYGSEERDALLRVFSGSAPSCGPEVLEFEKEFSEFNGSKYATAVSSATTGLELAMIAANIQEGDEVIIPSISWISSATCAASRGAIIRFADIDMKTGIIDLVSFQKLISSRTKAILVVHLYGRPCEYIEEIVSICHSQNPPILVIEDCAHSIGSQLFNKQTGTFGDIGVFSFHQQKNMTTLGEGGMVVTDSVALRDKIVSYRSLCAKSYDPKGKYLPIDQSEHPMENRYWLMDFEDIGYNYRMTDSQACVGRTQMKKVLNWNLKRKDIAEKYFEGLKEIKGLSLPVPLKSDETVQSWHVFHILIEDSFPLSKADFMWEMLNTYQIKVWNHYSPMHLSTAFRNRGHQLGECPVAESFFEKSVSLPIHPRLTEEAISYLIQSITSISKLPKKELKAPLINSLISLSNPKKEKLLKDEKLENDFVVLKENISNCDLFSKNEALFVSRAPGRLDLMGGNDDYTGGLVFEATITEATWSVSQKRNDKKFIFLNPQMSEKNWKSKIELLVEILNSVDSVKKWLSENLDCRWMAYVLGVLFWLKENFHENVDFSCGVTCFIWGDVPLNRGVSSSASVEVATMKSIAATFGIDLNGETLATACQWAENVIADSACGIMDQMAVTLGGKNKFMPMICQPSIVQELVALPSELEIFAIDSGVSHQVSGIEYEAARAACFMGYKIICDLKNISVKRDKESKIDRFTDEKWNGYLANLSPSLFRSQFESTLPAQMSGKNYLEQHKEHVDPATNLLPDYNYKILANTKYAVEENHRVQQFVSMLRGISNNSKENNLDTFKLLGELMYQSHYAYTECGLGCKETDQIVNLVREVGPENGLFGAKITGGGAGGTVAILGLKSAKQIFYKEVVEKYKIIRNNKEPKVFEGTNFFLDTWIKEKKKKNENKITERKKGKIEQKVEKKKRNM